MHSRFGHLRASSVLSRLQLAALYAATSTLLPEPQSHATGAQTALGLLREAWVHRPLRGEEREQLEAVGRLGGHLLPALRVLVADQLLSSAQVHFLHCPAEPPPSPLPRLDRDAASAYLQRQGDARRLHLLAGFLNPRAQLQGVEERRVLGSVPPAPSPPAWMQGGRHRTLPLPPCPVSSALVTDTEARLRALVVESDPTPEVPAYPLEVREGARPLEEGMHGELRESWEVFHRLAKPLGMWPEAPDVIAACKVSDWPR